MFMCSQGGQTGLFMSKELKAGRATMPARGGGQSAPGSCCPDNSLQGCNLSLRDLRKPRVGFWFRDSCTLVRLHFYGRTRAAPPSKPPSTDSTKVSFHFAGLICLELRNSALSSPEVSPTAAASAFFPNDTHGSTLVSRLAAVGCSRPCPACGSQAPLPYPSPRGNSQVGNAVTTAFSFLLLAAPAWAYTHTYTCTHTPCTCPEK